MVPAPRMAHTGNFRIAASPHDQQTLTDEHWLCGVPRDALRGLDHLAVVTRNTTYELFMLSSETGDVLIRGGEQFPEFTRARLSGGSPGSTSLTPGTICPGFTMELVHGGRRTITTRVREVTPVDK